MKNKQKMTFIAMAIKVNSSVVITIPKAICEHYGILKDDKILLSLDQVIKEKRE